ncbi:hypothetical protein [Flavisphingomonas formosensis]|uniref:hypothetical protein n=1 Tax=Flavisphingomonas formosensis TaxID=861534 RepID=UPI0012F831EF|nr:hypothetical protein [Sphingomonas formosensis]
MIACRIWAVAIAVGAVGLSHGGRAIALAPTFNVIEDYRIALWNRHEAFRCVRAGALTLIRDKQALDRRLLRIRDRLVTLRGSSAVEAIERRFGEQRREVISIGCSTVDHQSRAQARYRNQVKFLERQTGLRQ